MTGGTGLEPVIERNPLLDLWWTRGDTHAVLGLQAHKKQGDLQFVKDVQIKNALFKCKDFPDGSGRQTILLDLSGRVDQDNEFKLEFKDDFRHYIFTGDISNSGKKAKGFFFGSHDASFQQPRAGTQSGPAADRDKPPVCHTGGRVDWKAQSLDE